MITIEPAIIALVPIVSAVIQVTKGVFYPKQYSPLIAMILGVLFAWLLAPSLLQIVLGGVIVGLSAVGAYEGITTLKSHR